MTMPLDTTQSDQNHSQALADNGMYVFMGEVDDESIRPIIDVMRSSNIPIKTVGLGQIASAGLLIFLAGTPGRRTLTPNTSIMSHQYAWGSDGKHHELLATIREFELTQKRMVQHYIDCTGLSEDQIKQHLLPPHDVYLGADDALRLGICDHISQLSR